MNEKCLFFIFILFSALITNPTSAISAADNLTDSNQTNITVNLTVTNASNPAAMIPTIICDSDTICEELETNINCPADCLKKEAKICDAGARRCDGNMIQECIAEGTQWNYIQACPSGCGDAKCLMVSAGIPTGYAVSDMTTVSILIAAIVIIVVIILSVYFIKFRHRF